MEDNNQGMARVYVSALNAEVSAMAVEGAGGLTALAYNQESSITVTVASSGSEGLTSVGVRLYLGDPSAGGVSVGTDRRATSVPAGGSKTVSFPFTPAQLGTFRLFALVDPNDELMEFNELDNEADMAVTVGHPPIWDDIADLQMVEDGTKFIDLTRYITDYDTDLEMVELSINAITTNMVTATISGKVVKIEPTSDWFGQFELELLLDDGDFSAITDLGVTVSPSNDAPRFRNEGAGEVISLMEGERFHFVFDAVDPDGEPVMFTDNSELFDISPEGVIDYTPTFDDIGYSPIHVFRVIATDGRAQAFFPLTLEFELLNTAPEVSLPSEIFLVVGTTLTMEVDGWDREGDGLTFSDDTDMFNIIPMTGQVVFTPTESMVGEHEIIISVTDGVHETSMNVTLYIYDKVETRDTETANTVALTAEIALVIIGILFIFNFRRRAEKERRRLEEEGEE
jgi:hypothetical protein